LAEKGKILEYGFSNDVLFKMLFAGRTDLLKKFIALILELNEDDITEFVITNPELPPKEIGDKFCRLDINMAVDGVRVILEVQVENKGDFRDRSLFYWSREFSSSLKSGRPYSSLPKVIFISFLDFVLFEGGHYLKKFNDAEELTGEKLTDKKLLIFVETKKLPPLHAIDKSEVLALLFWLFRAKTEEELKAIEDKGVPVVNDMINEYRDITVSDKFRELDRLRERARHDEASAIKSAVESAVVEVNLKWQSVVEAKDKELAALRAELARSDSSSN
jgi:predicted transposase/invertase (TIGR01784 family)